MLLACFRLGVMQTGWETVAEHAQMRGNRQGGRHVQTEWCWGFGRSSHIWSRYYSCTEPPVFIELSSQELLQAWLPDHVEALSVSGLLVYWCNTADWQVYGSCHWCSSFIGPLMLCARKLRLNTYYCGSPPYHSGHPTSVSIGYGLIFSLYLFIFWQIKPKKNSENKNTL